MTDRYSRQERLPQVGPDGQQRLREARVLIVGVGGLGAPAAHALAGAGVGTIGLMDADTVELSNLHRQPLYATSDIGLSKVQAAARRLLDINPETEVRPIEAWLTASGAADFLWGYDVVLSCTDDVTAQYALNDACRAKRIPLVHAAVAQWEGELLVVLPSGPCLRCLRPDPVAAPSCEADGVLGTVPNVLGLLQATEAVKILLREPVEGGRLHLLDLRANNWQTVSFESRPGCGHGVTMPLACPAPWAIPPSPDISVADFEPRKAEFFLVDVREEEEFDDVHIDGARLIPLRELTERLDEIPRESKVVCICSVGGRSGRATMILREHGYNALNLRGGMRAWLSR